MSEYTCQSCGLGIDDESMLGTYPDGRKNTDYCIHCFRDGEFAHPGITMEEQIELNLSGDNLENFNRSEDTSFSLEGARKVMNLYFPSLKRWMPVVSKASWILERTGYGVLSTINENGFPVPAAVDIIAGKGIRELWMTTFRSSHKVRNIERNPRCGMCFVHEADSISLAGCAEIITDSWHLQHFWKDGFSRYFPSGASDPEYCLIRFAAESAELWIDGKKEHLDLADEKS